MNIPCEYPYKPAAGRMIICAIVAGIGCAFLANQALHNNAGLIINGIFRFDQNGATGVYWFLAAACGVGTLLGIMGAIQSMTDPKVLRLDAETLTLPHGFLLKETARIQYSAIKALSEQQVSSQTMLHLATHSGKYTLMASMLPSKDDYVAIRTFLASKAQSKK
jgi:hypothetical protein